MGRLEGKIAVVTRANSGIGLASARRFVAEGAQSTSPGAAKSNWTRRSRRSVAAVQGDMSNLDDLDRLFSKVRSDYGRVDVLMANAGAGALEPLGKITEAAFDLIFGVKVKGTVFTVQKGLPPMPEGESIILTGSTTASMGRLAFSVYSASKAAMRNLARSWALDPKGTGIRVSVLSPGPTAAPGLVNGLAKPGKKDAMIADLIARTLLGRLSYPSEIAAVALSLPRIRAPV